MEKNHSYPYLISQFPYVPFSQHPYLKQLFDISGNWQTNHGPMTLNLQRDRVTVLGTYRAGNSNGEIIATLRGNQLVGYWRRLYPSPGVSRSSGRIQFNFSSDANTFDGVWSYDVLYPATQPTWVGKWTGNRTSRG